MPPEMQVSIMHAHRPLFCPWPFFCFKHEPKKKKKKSIRIQLGLSLHCLFLDGLEIIGSLKRQAHYNS